MKKRIRLAAEKHLKQVQRRRNWRKVVRAMACVVVFCTTYALILPAITMERDECTLTEHVHSESCYEKVLTETVKVLNCSYDSLGVHVHEADCLDAEGILICGEADYLVHTHSGECYDAEGVLMCGLPKVEEHEHTEDCYGIVETEPAETEATEGTLPEDGEGDAEAAATEPALPEDGEGDAEAATEPTLSEEGEDGTAAALELICDKEVIVLHSHDEEDCYETYLDEEGNEQKRLICTQVIVLEHNHDESCFVTEEVLVEDADALTCPLAEGHVHAEACYDETGTLICEEVENHTHGDMCYGTWTLICGQEEHTHDEGCVFPEEMEPNTLRYRGKDYEVTVRYEDSAEIPENAQLTVRELSGEEYREHLQQVYDELGIESANTLIQLGTEGVFFGDSGDNAAAVSGEVDFARFFDITILADGQEIEPKSTVEVSIIYNEGVEIPEGEKAAVHFSHDGTVEVLEVNDGAAEQEPQGAVGYILQNTGKKRQSETEENGNAFVFHQDSFSVTATITLGSENEPPLFSNSSTNQTIDDLNWPAKHAVSKTLTIYADYGDNPSSGKSIEVQVPTGFVIEGYSVKKGMNPLSGADKILIHPNLDGLVSDKMSLVSATPIKEGNTGYIAGLSLGSYWPDQQMSGYTSERSTIDSYGIRTYGGNITWPLDNLTQTMELKVNLSIQQELLSHMTEQEAMAPIVIKIHSAQGTVTTTINVNATDIPVVKINRSSGAGGTQHYYANLNSDVANRSAVFPVSCTVSNLQGDGGARISYAENAVFELVYPTGVYYEPNSAFCELLGLSADELNLTRNGTVTVKDSGDNNIHLVAKCEERSGGGGKITWTLTKFTMNDFAFGEALGASFRADRSFGTDKPIKGFSMTMTSYQRNGKTHTSGPIDYTRQLISGDGKDIQIYAKNFTRRNITGDFGLSEYDYALGGFDVKSALAYKDNTFYFSNPHGLNITALNLMGKNIRDIYVYTNYHQSWPIDVHEEFPQYFVPYTYEVNGKPKTVNVYSENAVYGEEQAGTKHSGTLLELSKIGGREGEYITRCIFVADTDQLTYEARYEFSGFVYIGQFDPGQQQGKPVYLQQLKDGTSFESALQYEDLNTHIVKDWVFWNPAMPRDDHFVFAADQTTIGWTNTGVGSVKTTAILHVEDEFGDANTQIFHPGDIIEILSEIKSGFLMQTQDMLIDPVLVINLPEGISVKMDSVRLSTYENRDLECVLERDTTFTEVNGVQWTTYRFIPNPEKYPPDPAANHKCLLISPERLVTGDLKDYIWADVHLVVENECIGYNLSLQDIVMWDVRNTAGAADSLHNVTMPGISGDAVDSHWFTKQVHEDRNNFLGYGPAYSVGNNGDTITTNPQSGLIMDMGIKPIENRNDPKITSGFTTYNGQDASIVWVEPGKYVDVKLTYKHTAQTPYYTGTVIYVPIPKADRNYGDSSRSYFQNINLTSPREVNDFRKFGFSMDLTDVVNLISEDGTVWKTYYGVDYSTYYVAQNQKVHQPPTDNVDNWEPVMWYKNNSSQEYNINWVDAQGMSDWMWKYADVRVVKFVAQNQVPKGGTGNAIMRLKVHEANAESGPATYGTVNYWRAYGKAVTKESTLQGDWSHTSVVAAAPTGETVVGQIFVDNQPTHHVFTPAKEPKYGGGKYTVEIYEKLANGTYKKCEDASIIVDKNGAFALKDPMGKTEYLPAGNYQVRIKDNDKEFYIRNGTSSSPNPYLGLESPENQWYNNVSASDGGTATFDLTIGNGEQLIHRIGVGVKPCLKIAIKGKKTLLGGTLKGGDFTFTRYEKQADGSLKYPSSVKNDENGWFNFSEIEYQGATKKEYVIRETVGNVPNMTYDTVDHLVKITIVSDPATGRLISTVEYDNSASPYEEDSSVTKWAAFTNKLGHYFMGQIFIDSNQNGIFDSGEKGYLGQTRNKCTVTLSGNGINKTLTVNNDGSFALLDDSGSYMNLDSGEYTVTIVEKDVVFGFAGTSYLGSIGEESPANQWRNNVSGTYNYGATSITTTWKFTVDTSGTGDGMHRLGIALKSQTSQQIRAYKSLDVGTPVAGDYTFRLTPLKNAPYNKLEATNNSRYANFGYVYYYKPGTYQYEIREVRDNPKPGMIYDTHTAYVTIEVTETTIGTLSSTVKYDNSYAITASDRAVTSYAPFTNRMGYELPATGGAGTTSYTMGGLLMVTAAILLYIYTPKRRKEDHASF